MVFSVENLVLVGNVASAGGEGEYAPDQSDRIERARRTETACTVDAWLAGACSVGALIG